MQNFYTSPEQFLGDRVILTGDEYHHATRACRVRVGDLIGVTDGRGRRVEASIEDIDRTTLVAHLERDLSGRGEPPADITLALSLIKPARFETAVEKCTELGVRRIIPLAVKRCERENAKLNPDRLRRIVLESAKQSGRSWIPEIDSPVSLEPVCRRGGLLLAALLEAERGIDSALVREYSVKEITILIGPEGDFTPEERTLMSGCGVIPISLGGLTLRAETAAIAATALTVEALRGAHAL
ncbi:MAG: RsmE family RNA methyltransferase [Candidatus Latescibacterota bacterium]